MVDASEMMGQDDGTEEMDDDYVMELGEHDGSDAHNPEAEAIILASNAIRERELASTVRAHVNEERGGVRDAQQSERSRLTARPTAKRAGGRRKKSTSRLRGVNWDKGSKKWQARITIGGKEKRLGRFVDEADAGRAFDGAVIANNLDRPLNFPAPGPGGAASSAAVVAVPSKKIVQLWRQRVHAPVRVRWNRVWYDAWIGDSELEFTDEKGSRNRKVKAGFVRVRFMGGSYCDVRDDARSVQERLAATSRVDEGEQLQPLPQPHAAELAVDASDEDMDDDDGMVWGADDSSDEQRGACAALLCGARSRDRNGGGDGG